jgi:hypothetical protein
MKFNGVSFPVVRTVADFVATTASSDRVALRLRTEQYATHMRNIMRQFDSKYTPSSPEYQAFKHTSLVCAGCGWQFPGSFTLSLIGALDGSTQVVGATPGYAEFGKTATCTKCGSAESFLTYQRYEPSSISQADVDAIRRYWRHSAKQWWSNTSRSTAICDGCNNDVSQARTYLIGGRLECEHCTDEQLVDGLNELRRNPFCFGARAPEGAFLCGRVTSPTCQPHPFDTFPPASTSYNNDISSPYFLDIHTIPLVVHCSIYTLISSPTLSSHCQPHDASITRSSRFLHFLGLRVDSIALRDGPEWSYLFSFAFPF